MANVDIRLWGYCDRDEAGLRDLFLRQGAAALRELGGEYVVAVESEGERWLISSPNGVVQHYYALAGGRLFHGDTVLQVLRESGLAWRWNFETLGDVAFLDHVLEEETLHPEIHRLPADAVLHVKEGRLSVSARPWEERFAGGGRSTPEEALEAFNRACAAWMREDSVVSMSGGFDSRVILSAFLAKGRKPELLTMGGGKSTDLVISQAVAERFGLRITCVEPGAEDYLQWGPRIAELGNGVKTAWHWHTYIYPRKAAEVHGRTLFIGANGEFARSYFLDRGLFARLANLAPGLTLPAFWKKKLRAPLSEEQLGLLTPELRGQFSAEKQAQRIERVCRLCGKGLLEGLDRFYLGERVRNFIANGLRLYADTVEWRSPFLASDWTDRAWRLPRGWKLDCAWHRYAIERNCRELLEFPEEKRGPRMSARPQPFYWLRPESPVIPYVDYRKLFQDPRFEEVLREGMGELKDLVDGSAAARIIDSNRQSGGGQTRLIAMLLPLIHWGRLVRGR